MKDKAVERLLKLMNYKQPKVKYYKEKTSFSFAFRSLIRNFAVV